MFDVPSPSEIAVAVAAGITGLAGNAAATGLASEGFLVGSVDDVVVALTPSVVVRFSIQRLGDIGHALFVAVAVATTILAIGATALLGQRIAERADSATAGVVATGGFAATFALVATRSPMAAIGTGVGSALAVGIALVRASPSQPVSLDRRRAIEYVAGVGVLAAAGTATGVLRTRADYEAVGGQEPEQMLQDAADASISVDGLGGLVSTRAAHYEVDINAFDPSPNPATHTVSLTGAVDAETTITMQELRAMETENRYNTLRCVGDDLNGEKIDTAVWTGTPTNAVLDAVEPTSDCECVMLHAADGYYVQFPLDALRGGLLAYGMNGAELPQGHGAPLRTLVPGHWGETNVKWLTEIEFLEEPADGYWEEKGWHGTGPVETVAKIHATERQDDGSVVVAGPAYAGTRGIERVEVSVDGGDSWQQAELTEELPGDDVWRQWHVELDVDGPTEVTTRAVDGTGRLQPEERSGSYPSGASGWVTEEVSP